MSIRMSRWLRSKTGVRIVGGTLAFFALVAILGQLLGWWPAVLKRLQGAGTEGVYSSQVQLAYFTASASTEEVTIAWATDVEIYNAGFNLYRAAPGGSPAVRLNAELIPSQATGGATSAVYQFTDSTANGGLVYEYRLESIDLQALPTDQGVVTVEVPPGSAGSAPGPSHLVFLPLIRR